jgi:TolB-like protein
LLAGWAHAQPPVQRFAVLEFNGSKKMEPDDLQVLSDQARAGALSVLPRNRFLVVTRESMLSVLRQMGKKDCEEGECEVDTLQNIGADFGVTGKVVYSEGTYLVTLKLFDARSGALLATGRAEGEKKKDLWAKVEDATARLVKGGMALDAPQTPPRELSPAAPATSSAPPQAESSLPHAAAPVSSVKSSMPPYFARSKSACPDWSRSGADRRAKHAAQIAQLQPHERGANRADLTFRLAQLFMETAYCTEDAGKAATARDKALSYYGDLLAQPEFIRRDEVLFTVGLERYQAGQVDRALQLFWELIKQTPRATR